MCRDFAIDIVLGQSQKPVMFLRIGLDVSIIATLLDNKLTIRKRKDVVTIFVSKRVCYLDHSSASIMPKQVKLLLPLIDQLLVLLSDRI